jgi:mono/diheme cytochrome c family protein
MRAFALSLAFLLVVGGCGDGAPTAAPAGPTEEMPGESMPETPPETPPATPTTAAPEGGFRGDVAGGQAIYSLYCVTCHGVAGKGDGPAAVALNPRPADHSDARFMCGLTDENIYKAIKEGGVSVGKSPLMAPWGAIVNEQGLRDLVAYVRSLSGT